MTYYDEIYIELPAGIKDGNKNPDTIVLHASSEFVYDDKQYYHILDFHKKEGLSAHVYVFPSGLWVKTKSFNDIAYHARNHNHNTIGIEFIMMGFNTYGRFLDKMNGKWYTDTQIDTGIAGIKKIISKYKISKITTHHELDPDRKYDPGAGFPTNLFKALI